MSGPFATATEFCEYTGMGLPSDLGRLQAILDLSSSVIRAFCSQELSEVADDVVTLSPVSRTSLILPERPVTDVSEVEVDGTVITDFWWTTPGILYRGTMSVSGVDWSFGATVTYSHGYAESDPEFIAIKSVCMDSASRAYTLNERSASEAMGSTLMESAGYSPEVFLTQGEMLKLSDFGKVLVG